MRKNLILIGMLLAAVFSASAQTGTWSGKLDVQGTKLSLVFHLDEENPTMDSPDQGAKGIPIEVTRSATGSITIKVPSIGATYEGIWLVKQIAGTFKQMGASMPLTLMPGKEKLNRPQTPQGPFPYAQEEVSFSNGDAVLKGTLVLPEGCTRNTPVLIMVTGSGLQNRDEVFYEHRPFAVIADAFARAGIATLRYDDRGFGESTGDIINCTTEDLKNDALAGIGLSGNVLTKWVSSATAKAAPSRLCWPQRKKPISSFRWQGWLCPVRKRCYGKTALRLPQPVSRMRQ